MMDFGSRTILLILFFSFFYLFYLMRKSAKREIDLIDTFLLSFVAFIPSIFAVFPKFTNFVVNLSGVTFPFVVWFGLLFAIIFFILIRVSRKIYKIENSNKKIIQELSIISDKIKKNEIE